MQNAANKLIKQTVQHNLIICSIYASVSSIDVKILMITFQLEKEKIWSYSCLLSVIQDLSED